MKTDYAGGRIVRHALETIEQTQMQTYVHIVE